MSDASPGLFDDFRTRGLEVSLPIGVVTVLIRIKITLGVRRVELADFPDRAIGALSGIGENELRAIRLENSFAFGRRVLRQAELDFVAARRADHRIRDACVSAGGIDQSLV